MADEAMTDPFYASAPVVDDDNLALDVRHFVLRYRVGVVLVDRATRHSAQVDWLLTQALGMAGGEWRRGCLVRRAEFTDTEGAGFLTAKLRTRSDHT
jgi:hypothetical protein